LDSYSLDVDVGGSEKSSSFQIGEHQAEKKKYIPRKGRAFVARKKEKQDLYWLSQKEK
jgi:hypothetical protein